MGNRHHEASLSLLVLLCLAVPAFAHHSVMAEFDEKNPSTLKGRITKLQWTNPHVYIHLDVKDQSGTTLDYMIETYSPVTLERAGVMKDMFREGQDVQVDAFPSKGATKTFVYLKSIRFSNGRQIAIKTPGFQ
jgi:hypothetical protein